MKNVLQSTERVANTDATVLILESGEEKRISCPLYPREYVIEFDKPFIAVNPAALPENF